MYILFLNWIWYFNDILEKFINCLQKSNWEHCLFNDQGNSLEDSYWFWDLTIVNIKVLRGGIVLFPSMPLFESNWFCAPPPLQIEILDKDVLGRGYTPSYDHYCVCLLCELRKNHALCRSVALSWTKWENEKWPACCSITLRAPERANKHIERAMILVPSMNMVLMMMLLIW